MAEAKLRHQGVSGKLREYWPWAIVLMVYLALSLIPRSLGETVIVQNLRFIGADRAWLLGVFYAAMPASGHACSFREVMQNLGRLAFGVALIVTGVTLFPALIPTFYLVPALAIAGAGAFLGALSGPRGLNKAMRHALDPQVSESRRLFRCVVLATAGLLTGVLVLAWGWQVFAHRDWTALAYGLCGLWGILIARPAFAGKG
jgi:hypothetical protein